MAKKEFTLKDAVDRFLDAMAKGGYTKFVRVNNTLYGRNKKNVGLFIKVDTTLWNEIPDTFKANIRELNMNVPEDRVIQDKFDFSEKFNGGDWIPIPDEVFQTNEMYKIELKGFPYNLEFNSKIFPIRFKKEDVNNISYKLEFKPAQFFIIKKVYDSPIPDTTFTIFRVFHLI